MVGGRILIPYFVPMSFFMGHYTVTLVPMIRALVLCVQGWMGFARGGSGRFPCRAWRAGKQIWYRPFHSVLSRLAQGTLFSLLFITACWDGLGGVHPNSPVLWRRVIRCDAPTALGCTIPADSRRRRQPMSQSGACDWFGLADQRLVLLWFLNP